jgi:apolipoprotein N-acyltransferase
MDAQAKKTIALGLRHSLLGYAKSQQVGEPLYYNSIMASGSESLAYIKSNVLFPLVNIFRFRNAWVLPAMQNDISMSGFSRGE